MDMLDSMVAAVGTPDAVHRKLEALGPAHTRHGARALEHMPVFQRALGRLLLDGLGEAGLTDEVLCVGGGCHARRSVGMTASASRARSCVCLIEPVCGAADNESLLHCLCLSVS